MPHWVSEDFVNGEDEVIVRVFDCGKESIYSRSGFALHNPAAVEK